MSGAPPAPTTGLHDLASALARSFGLSQDYHRQLHTMLLGIAPYALYDLTAGHDLQGSVGEVVPPAVGHDGRDPEQA